MAKQSDFTRAVQNVMTEIKFAQESAAKTGAIPFMTERLSGRDTRARFEQMLPDERLAFLDQNDPLAVMKLLQGRDLTS